MDPLRRLTEIALALTVVAAAVVVFAQVVLRYVFSDPRASLDEFATLAFAWMILLGAALVVRDESHMAIEVFVKSLPLRAQGAIYALRVAGVSAILILLAWQGWRLFDRMAFIEYPAMEISRGWLFAILPVCAPLMLYFQIRAAVERFADLRRGKPPFGHGHIPEEGV